MGSINKAPKYARNKSEAAKLAGMSRAMLYALLRLPDAPIPKADGRWDVEAIRRFALKSAHAIREPAIERDKLQVRLLDLKVQRAAQDLNEFEEKLRKKITDEIVAAFSEVFATARTELLRVIDGLAQYFESRELGKKGRRLIVDALVRSVELVQERNAALPENVLPFGEEAEQRAAEG
jgi:hypothetical protein